MGRHRVPYRIETGSQPAREKIALMVAHREDSSNSDGDRWSAFPKGSAPGIRAAVSSMPPFAGHDFSNVVPRFETHAVPNILIL